MEWTISHIPEGNIIHIETSGQMTVEMLKQMISEALEANKRHNSKLILVDHRKVHIALSCAKAFNQPKEFDRLGSTRNLRIAEVCSEKDQEKFRFLETVSLNTGHQVRIFKDIELAKKWLIS